MSGGFGKHAPFHSFVTGRCPNVGCEDGRTRKGRSITKRTTQQLCSFGFDVCAPRTTRRTLLRVCGQQRMSSRTDRQTLGKGNQGNRSLLHCYCLRLQAPLTSAGREPRSTYRVIAHNDAAALTLRFCLRLNKTRRDPLSSRFHGSSSTQYRLYFLFPETPRIM